MGDPILWRGILIHHSATEPDYPWDGIVTYHVTPPPRGRGWRAVGYNYGIEADGKGGWKVREGRSVNIPGAHCPGQNQIALGVCLIGDFTKEPPPDGQLAVAADLCAELCERWGILPIDIRPHRAFRKTECPGKAFTDLRFKAFRDQVMQILVHG